VWIYRFPSRFQESPACILLRVTDRRYVFPIPEGDVEKTGTATAERVSNSSAFDPFVVTARHGLILRVFTLQSNPHVCVCTGVLVLDGERWPNAAEVLLFAEAEPLCEFQIGRKTSRDRHPCAIIDTVECKAVCIGQTVVPEESCHGGFPCQLERPCSCWADGLCRLHLCLHRQLSVGVGGGELNSDCLTAGDVTLDSGNVLIKLGGDDVEDAITPKARVGKSQQLHHKIVGIFAKD
jgi:hypothetical protein